jgi:hypothetical protein
MKKVAKFSVESHGDHRLLEAISSSDEVKKEIIDYRMSGEGCNEVPIYKEDPFPIISLMKPGKTRIEYMKHFLQYVDSPCVYKLYSFLEKCDSASTEVQKLPVTFWSGEQNVEGIPFKRSVHFNSFDDLSNSPISVLSRLPRDTFATDELKYLRELSAGNGSMFLAATTSKPAFILYLGQVHINSDLFFNEFPILAYQNFRHGRQFYFFDVAHKVKSECLRRPLEETEKATPLEEIPINIESIKGGVHDTGFTMKDYYDYVQKRVEEKKVHTEEDKLPLQELFKLGLEFRELIVKKTQETYTVRHDGAKGRLIGAMAYMQNIVDAEKRREIARSVTPVPMLTKSATVAAA